MALINKDLDFMGKRRIAAIISAFALLVCIASLAVNNLQLGLDFTSGTLIELGYQEPVDVQQVSDTLTEAGYEEAVVVNFGSNREVLVRLPVGTGAEEESADSEAAASAASSLGNEILQVLQQANETPVQMRRSEYVGPALGQELAERGGLGMLVALGIVLLYVSARFQMKFALGAVAALAHDVTIVLGVFSLFRMTFDLTVLAALLAVIGYSLNDTIVVSDRIRENFRIMRSGTPEFMINASLNQVLSRTLITTFTTLLVLVSMLVAGGEAIQGFAIALILGVVVGTYSSIYVAANVLMYMNVSREDLAVPVKEGEGEPDISGP